jgi:hypothetical protein
MEAEFRELDISYQKISVNSKEKYILILCNDPEEREHIRHILLKNHQIWCIESEMKRFYPKDVTEEKR